MTVGQGKDPFRFKNTGIKVKITEKTVNSYFFKVKVKRNAGSLVILGENER